MQGEMRNWKNISAIICTYIYTFIYLLYNFIYTYFWCLGAIYMNQLNIETPNKVEYYFPYLRCKSRLTSTPRHLMPVFNEATPWMDRTAQRSLRMRRRQPFWLVWLFPRALGMMTGWFSCKVFHMQDTTSSIVRTWLISWVHGEKPIAASIALPSHANKCGQKQIECLGGF